MQGWLLITQMLCPVLGAGDKPSAENQALFFNALTRERKTQKLIAV